MEEILFFARRDGRLVLNSKGETDSPCASFLPFDKPAIIHDTFVRFDFLYVIKLLAKPVKIILH